MLGKINPDIKRVTVVGAGISGLLAAYRLNQVGYEVTIVEAGSTPGGLISTRKTAFGMSETAAHSLLASKPVTDLLNELKLKYVGVRKGSRARYIVRSGKMKRIPLSLKEIAELIRRAMFTKAPKSIDQSLVERTVENWGKIHLGQAAVDYLLTPFLLGVYGSTSDKVTLSAAFPGLVVAPGKTLFRTLLSRNKKQRHQMIALENGTGSLVEALSTKLSNQLNGRFLLNHSIDQLPTDTNTVLTVPAHIASSLLIKRFPKIAEKLSEVEYSPLITCTVFVRNDQHNPPRGVGVLIPPTENSRVLGILFNSSSFAGRSSDEVEISSYTAILGGPLHRELLTASDLEIKSIIKTEFKTLFNLSGEAEHSEVIRWERAIPVYSSRLQDLSETASEELSRAPGTVIFGNYTGQISLRGLIEESLDFLKF